jgi:hypothetical protein
MSDHELMPAITLMERKVDEAVRKVNELLGALNVLRVEAGLPPRPGGGSGGDGSSAADPIQTQIKGDTFFGKKQQTAIKQYLEMRRAQGLGTAKPRDIYDALAAGGYEFEAKNADIALVGIRALLRKRTETFVQLKNGTYGLIAWYPDLKKAKAATATEAVDDDDDVTADVAAAVNKAADSTPVKDKKAAAA